MPCAQSLKQLGENVRSAGNPKRQNSKLEKPRMTWNKLPQESQIFEMIWKNILHDGILTLNQKRKQKSLCRQKCSYGIQILALKFLFVDMQINVPQIQAVTLNWNS